jgi:hypothetical protein
MSNIATDSPHNTYTRFILKNNLSTSRVHCFFCNGALFHNLNEALKYAHRSMADTPSAYISTLTDDGCIVFLCLQRAGFTSMPIDSFIYIFGKPIKVLDSFKIKDNIFLHIVEDNRGKLGH